MRHGILLLVLSLCPRHLFKLIVIRIDVFIALILHHVHILLTLSGELADVVIVKVQENFKVPLLSFVDNVHDRDQAEDRYHDTADAQVENELVAAGDTGCAEFKELLHEEVS